MTRISIIAFAAVLGAACAPVSTPLQINKFIPIDSTTCNVVGDDTVFTSGGSLDIAPGGTPTFLVGLLITGGNEFTQPEYTLRGGIVLEPADRSKPVIDRLVLSYTARPTTLGLRLDQAQYTRALPFTDDGSLRTFLNLISPQVAEELVAKVAPGDDVELLVSVEGRGYMSGDRAAVSTGPLVFPIRVFATDPATCAGAIRQPVAGQCLYPGQGSHSSTAAVCCADLVSGTSGCP